MLLLRRNVRAAWTVPIYYNIRRFVDEANDADQAVDVNAVVAAQAIEVLAIVDVKASEGVGAYAAVLETKRKLLVVLVRPIGDGIPG